ncbi:MAG: GtrA family protein [Candidatus Nitrotoga sp.]|nr:GtrA family protein [Candidatus Nitrotoga sp.]
MPKQSKNSQQTLRTQFLLFAGVGVIGTAAHYSVLVALVQLAQADAVISSTLGFVVGACVNYTLNYLFTFNSSKRHLEALPKFFTIALLGMVANAAIMTGLVRQAGVHYFPAQIVATMVVLVWNFAGSKIWVFREKRSEQ